MKLWNATYDGRECVVREVTQDEGEYVVTNDGNVHVRKGDYVALDLVRAPRGYKSRHIEKVIRTKDNRLVLVNLVESPDETEEGEVDYLDDEE